MNTACVIDPTQTAPIAAGVQHGVQHPLDPCSHAHHANHALFTQGSHVHQPGPHPLQSNALDCKMGLMGHCSPLGLHQSRSLRPQISASTPRIQISASHGLHGCGISPVSVHGREGSFVGVASRAAPIAYAARGNGSQTSRRDDGARGCCSHAHLRCTSRWCMDCCMFLAGCACMLSCTVAAPCPYIMVCCMHVCMYQNGPPSIMANQVSRRYNNDRPGGKRSGGGRSSCGCLPCIYACLVNPCIGLSRQNARRHPE